MRVLIELRNGTRVAIPTTRVKGLSRRAGEDVADVTIEGRGEYLRWPRLDVDHSVPILLEDAIGIRSVATNARHAGATITPAKAAAARMNGAKGGRPKKIAAPAKRGA